MIEVMIATMILAMLVFSLYRFISTTLRALDATTRLSEERQEIDALARLVQLAAQRSADAGQRRAPRQSEPIPRSGQ